MPYANIVKYMSVHFSTKYLLYISHNKAFYNIIENYKVIFHRFLFHMYIEIYERIYIITKI